jgi:formylglycine-generating enzyme required for sulfatase activity
MHTGGGKLRPYDALQSRSAELVAATDVRWTEAEVSVAHVPPSLRGATSFAAGAAVMFGLAAPVTARPAGAPDQDVRRRIVMCLAPVVREQPVDATVAYPDTARLTVAAEGTTPLAYRWSEGEAGDTTRPVGEDAPALTTPVLEAATRYWVRVENPCGRTDSTAAQVTVTGAPAPEITVYLGPGDTVPLTLLRIRAGTFRMGAAPLEDYIPHDDPQHAVSIPRGYYLGKLEVTQEQWRAVMGTTPSHHADCDDCPVEMVSWLDVAGPGGFIETLNLRLGTTAYRLPTEAEWEFAARAGTTTEFSFPVPPGWNTGCHLLTGLPGTPFPAAEPYMWWCGNTTHSQPAGTRLPNPWGLHDMHGSIWEWVEDWWHTDYTGAPSDGSAWLDPPGELRTLRGGSWFHARAYELRSAHRFCALPDHRTGWIGFRLAMTM